MQMVIASPIRRHLANEDVYSWYPKILPTHYSVHASRSKVNELSMSGLIPLLTTGDTNSTNSTECKSVEFVLSNEIICSVDTLDAVNSLMFLRTYRRCLLLLQICDSIWTVRKHRVLFHGDVATYEWQPSIA